MSYNKLINDIHGIVENAMSNKRTDMNLITTQSFQEIGKRIVLEEQQGKLRAAYGKKILLQLSHDLNQRYGKGYGLTRLKHIRIFYRTYKKSEINPELSYGFTRRDWIM